MRGSLVFFLAMRGLGAAISLPAIRARDNMLIMLSIMLIMLRIMLIMLSMLSSMLSILLSMLNMLLSIIL